MTMLRRAAFASTILAITVLSASAARADGIFANIVASRQGALRGDATSAAHAGQTVVASYLSEVRVPTDTSTGQATGKRQYAPITFTKAIGASSPQLFQALVTNEVLTTVTFDFVQTQPDGTQPTVFRIQLKNALVTDIKQHPTSASHTTWQEDVSLVFQSITVTHVTTGITATDNPASGA
jgi:type VI secretion system Hcp family effector